MNNSIWIETATLLYKLQQERRALEKQEKEVAAQLQALSGHQTTQQGNFLYEVTMRRGVVNYALIPELKQVDLELYRKEDTRSWKLKWLL